MLDEEVIVKHSKNGNERLLIINALLMVFVPMFFLGGNNDISIGLFIAMGIIAPINVANYARTWVEANAHTLRNYIIALLPYFAVLAFTILGLCNPVLKTVLSGSGEYFAIDTSGAGSFVSASINSLQPITLDLVTISAVAYALSIFFITDSRYIIRRIFFYCVSAVAVWTVFGLIYELILDIFGRENLPNFGPGAFFTFPHKSHWSAFSIAWLGAGLTNAIYSAQRFRLKSFSLSLRSLSLLSCAIILWGICYCGTPLERSIAYVLCLFGFFVLVLDTVPTRKNMDRHWMSKYSQSLHKITPRFYVPCAVYTLLALSFAFMLFHTCAKSLDNPNEMLLVNSSDESAITLVQKHSLVNDCLCLVKERPMFGWGAASFPNVFAFKQGGDLGDSVWITPHSDFLCKLVEYGFAGLALSMLMPMFFFFRWLFKCDFSASGAMIFLTCLSLLVMSVLSDPFQCIAAYASFWTLLISAFRWDSATVR